MNNAEAADKPTPDPAAAKHSWLRLVSWFFSFWFLFTGAFLLTGLGGRPPLSAIPNLLAGLALFPPLIDRARTTLQFLKPMWAPPAIAAGIMIINALAAGAISARADRVEEQQLASSAAAPKAPKSRAETLAEVDSLLKQNTRTSIVRAVVEMEREFSDAERASDPELKALYARARSAQDPILAKEYAERILHRTLPSVAEISTAPPTSVSDIGERLQDIDSLAGEVRSGEPHLTPEAVAARAKLKAALSARQQAVLPVLRRGFAKLSAQTMWEHNVDVSAGGDGARILRFTGATFASNRNIAEVQRTGQEVTTKLRFRRTEYRWYRGADDYTYFDTKSPSDSVVATWNGSAFEPAK